MAAFAEIAICGAGLELAYLGFDAGGAELDFVRRQARGLNGFLGERQAGDASDDGERGEPSFAEGFMGALSFPIEGSNFCLRLMPNWQYECSRNMLPSTHTHNLSNVMARSVHDDG